MKYEKKFKYTGDSNVYMKYDYEFNVDYELQKGTKGSACYDLIATSKEVDNEKQIVIYGLGITSKFSENYVCKVYPRSSIYKQKSLLLSNGVGIIDSDYRGEWKMIFKLNPNSFSSYDDMYNIGDRVCQFMIEEICEPQKLINNSIINNDDRNENGFGSTNI